MRIIKKIYIAIFIKMSWIEKIKIFIIFRNNISFSYHTSSNPTRY